MFTVGHFIWLGIFAVVIISLLLVLKKFQVSSATVGKIVMIVAIVAKLFHLSLSMIESEYGGMILKQTQLDFHLCSIQVYLMILYILEL